MLKRNDDILRLVGAGVCMLAAFLIVCLYYDVMAGLAMILMAWGIINSIKADL